MIIPLRTDADGVIRIGDTRVLLELVIHAYYLGEIPEGIVESCPSLTTADVYAVIGYYLANRVEIDSYVRQRINELIRSYARWKPISPLKRVPCEPASAPIRNSKKSLSEI
jgi:uncharacterized protein (DUF433 family)